MDDLLSNAVWSNLQRYGFIEKFQQREISLNDLCTQARFASDTRRDSLANHEAGGPVIPKGGHPKTPDKDLRSLRRWALSLLLVQRARGDRLVIEFRKSVLSDALIEPEELEGWVQKRAEEDGEPTWWLTDLPIPSTHSRAFDNETLRTYADPPLEVSAENGAYGARFKQLKYAGPRTPWTQVALIAQGGVLEQLWNVANHLSTRFSWQESQAVGFVLTDGVPLVDHIRMTKSGTSPFTSLNRIAIHVDPTLTPKQVADHYRQTRDEIWGGRYRSPGEKHLRLVIFQAGTSQEKSWKDRMTEWNEEHSAPEWNRYTHESNFRRDCLKAVERVLKPDYQSPIPADDAAQNDQEIDND